MKTTETEQEYANKIENTIIAVQEVLKLNRVGEEIAVISLGTILAHIAAVVSQEDDFLEIMIDTIKCCHQRMRKCPDIIKKSQDWMKIREKIKPIGSCSTI